MKVILLQDVPNVGNKFEVAEVADGYAMNSLIPQSLAELATPDKLSQLETRRAKQQQEQQEADQQLKQGLEKIEGLVLTVEKKVSDKGHLFDSVGADDVVGLLKDQTGLSLESRHLDIRQPIKEVGEHPVVVTIGSEKAKFVLSITEAN